MIYSIEKVIRESKPSFPAKLKKQGICLVSPATYVKVAKQGMRASVEGEGLMLLALAPTCIFTHHETMVVVLGKQEILLAYANTYTECEGKKMGEGRCFSVPLSSSAPDIASCLTSELTY